MFGGESVWLGLLCPGYKKIIWNAKKISYNFVKKKKWMFSVLYVANSKFELHTFTLVISCQKKIATSKNISGEFSDLLSTTLILFQNLETGLHAWEVVYICLFDISLPRITFTC